MKMKQLLMLCTKMYTVLTILPFTTKKIEKNCEKWLHCLHFRSAKQFPQTKIIYL